MTLWSVLENSQLFTGISEATHGELLRCLIARERSYKKNAPIFMAGDAVRHVGLVLEGTVHVIQEDFWGNRTILANLAPGELFAESFAAAEAPLIPVHVMAIQATRVLLMDYKRILTTCSNCCGHHQQLIHNMMQILAQKNVYLTQKMELLTLSTTAEKILAYLSRQARAAGSAHFTIPFSRQELADYLSVNRSALSRELSRMQREGLLDYDRNTFSLHKELEAPL